MLLAKLGRPGPFRVFWALCGILFIAGLIWLIDETLRGKIHIKGLLGSPFLLAMIYACVNQFFFRTSQALFYDRQLEIKALLRRRIIDWRDVQRVYFSEKELEYKSLKTYSPALVVELKDCTRVFIWCSALRKAEKARKLASLLVVEGGKARLEGNWE